MVLFEKSSLFLLVPGNIVIPPGIVLLQAFVESCYYHQAVFKHMFHDLFHVESE